MNDISAKKSIKDKKKFEIARKSLHDLEKILKDFSLKSDIVETSTAGKWTSEMLAHKF